MNAHIQNRYTFIHAVVCLVCYVLVTFSTTGVLCSYNSYTHSTYYTERISILGYLIQLATPIVMLTHE